MDNKYSDPISPNPGDGVVRGDSKAMPDRGTGIGFVGMGGAYGASTDLNATNSMGSAHMDSDPADLCYPKGDADLRFSSSGHGTKDPGTHFHVGSDPMDEVMPDNPKGSPDPDQGDEA
jgi:hypothetical protein